MAESSIQLTLTNRAKTFRTNDGTNDVDAQAVVITDGDGDEVAPLTDAQLRAAPVEVTIAGATPGLTNTELRAAPVEVTIAGAAPGLTNDELRAEPVEVTIAGGVSGLTDTELRAAPISVSATALPLPAGAATESTLSGGMAALLTELAQKTEPADQQHVIVDAAVTVADGGGSITVDGPLTDAQLRAAPVPVSGALSDTELRASPIQVARQVSTSNLTNVAAAITNVTLLASNANRRGAVIVNDSVSSNLYVKFGAAATTSSFTYKLAPGVTLEVFWPVYTGIIDGIWDAAVGSARVTELTV